MIRSVYVYGSGVLRRDADEVPHDYPGLKELCEDMFQTMRASNGVGLAAPQIGLPMRMFVIDLTPYAEEHPEYEVMRMVFINPEIYWESDDEVQMEEGCLSIPGLNESVWRAERVRVRWMDEGWNEHDMEFEGFAARVVQHEYDHLSGKMFVDRLPPLRRTMLRNRLTAMGKGKYEAAYKTRVGK